MAAENAMSFLDSARALGSNAMDAVNGAYQGVILSWGTMAQDSRRKPFLFRKHLKRTAITRSLSGQKMIQINGRQIFTRKPLKTLRPFTPTSP